jgi:hypothetical protein
MFYNTCPCGDVSGPKRSPNKIVVMGKESLMNCPTLSFWYSLTSVHAPLPLIQIYALLFHTMYPCTDVLWSPGPKRNPKKIAMDVMGQREYVHAIRDCVGPGTTHPCLENTQVQHKHRIQHMCVLIQHHTHQHPIPVTLWS